MVNCRVGGNANQGDAVLAPSASMKNSIAMYNGNALKIGLFGANCSSGPLRDQSAGTLVGELARLPCAGASSPTRPASISCCRSRAGKATAATPIFTAARSRPSPGRSGLLCATKRMTVFGTVHAPLFHPLDRGQGIRHRRPHRRRPRRRQHRRRLERGRIRHVRRQAARARRALRLRPGMDRHRQAGMERATARSITTANFCSSRARAPIRNPTATAGR